MFPSSFMVLASFALVKSAKILVVIPTPSNSHQIVFRPLIQELVTRNHEVTVITADPAFPGGATVNNLRTINIYEMSYNMFEARFGKMGNFLDYDHLTALTLASHLLHDIFHYQVRDKSVLKLIREKNINFDFLILEECVMSSLVFSHIFKAPVILMSSHGDTHGNLNSIGAITHPFLYPTHFHQRLYNLTIWEKISELYTHMAFIKLWKNLATREDRILKNLFGIDTPALNRLKNNVQMLFLNVHPIWLNNQPVPPNFVSTWGIHKTPLNKLPQDLQDYLDSSKNGAIYFSLGTVIKSSFISTETLEILLNVFSRLPYNILWKWDQDELPGKSENIKIYKWLPQHDILRHPNLKLFITQGGLQSTEEAINAGIPLIGIPTFADQEYNTEKYMYFKIGIKLDFKTLTIEKLENAINTIFSDYDRYRQNILRFRTQMHDQPKPALEHTVWWIEYLLRHGEVQHLRTPAANMPWTEYYELELVFIVLTELIVLGSVVIFVLFTCFKRTSGKLKKILKRD